MPYSSLLFNFNRVYFYIHHFGNWQQVVSTLLGYLLRSYPLFELFKELINGDSGKERFMAGELCPTCKGRKTTVVKTALSGGVIFGIEVECPTCKGTGTVNDPTVCSQCNGSKTMVANAQMRGGATFGIEVACDECHGTGNKFAAQS
jgi:DnaJ-class molecular chaperone